MPKKEDDVVAEYANGHIVWKATQTGIIREDMSIDDTLYSFIPYKHITSITFEVRSYIAFLAMAIIAIVIGFGMFGIFSLQNNQILQIVGISSLVFGITLLIVYFFTKTSRIILTGANIDKKMVFQKVQGESKELENFVKIIKEKMEQVL